jgi:cell wall-associated NlpC family hydrolase
MIDRRLFAANERVAHQSLEGKLERVAFVKGTRRCVIAPVADLLAEPNGAIDRQLRFGEVFEVLEDHQGFAFGRTLMDGYVGYIHSAMLGPEHKNTHRVKSFGAHLYPEPNLKSRPIMALPFGGLIASRRVNGDFLETPNGYVFERQLEPAETIHADYIRQAENFLRVPYLWGGNSNWGIDCSGLVQMVLNLADIPCPPDSDMQEDEVGTKLDVTARLKRGDIVFWKGHVGLMQSATQIIHANAFHMSVTSENLIAVLKRIETAGGGRMTSSKRIAQR